MFILGTCNPRGEKDGYNGLYLTEQEIKDVVKNESMKGIPVKTEHGGEDIGTVISSFLTDDNELQCVLEIDDDNIEGSIVGDCIKNNIAQDLSLGYSVDIQNTGNKLKAQEKKIHEVSVVRKGARKNCHILVYEKDDKMFAKTGKRKRASLDRDNVDRTHFEEVFDVN